MLDEWDNPVEKRLQRRYVAVDEESEIDAKGDA
jgi:hypothetical protein